MNESQSESNISNWNRKASTHGSIVSTKVDTHQSGAVRNQVAPGHARRPCAAFAVRGPVLPADAAVDHALHLAADPHRALRINLD
ncbi:hypothetical protein, partial [Acinetobacter nosocomialis]|uniref:hypothetical protein n=1 Tax=Acinetobacter nosocomialis TaxID=106654 RepID=UPI001C0A039C